MSKNLAEDYNRFRTEIPKSTRSPFKDISKFEGSLKGQHKSIYCLALILTKVESQYSDGNKIDYLAEILSDCLIATKLLFLGFESSSLIVMRRAIENFYNHVFYFDHPIEYEHLNLGKNEYTPIDKLKLYFETHPIFKNVERQPITDYDQMLFNEYQQLCRVVHAKGLESMNLSKNLKDLKRDFDIKPLLELFVRIEVYIVYLLFRFHRSIKFTPAEISIIISAIPAEKRSSLTE